jgi:hypothetical protein
MRNGTRIAASRIPASRLATSVLVVLASACPASVDYRQLVDCSTGVCAAAQKVRSWSGCSLFGLSDPPLRLEPPDPTIAERYQEVALAAGMEQPPRLASGNVGNAQALFLRDAYGDERTLVVYSPEFFKTVSANPRARWLTWFALAHELGHHVEGHLLRQSGSVLERELEADAFATRILKKLGAEESFILEAVDAIPQISSPTHPDRMARLGNVRKAFYRRDPTSTRERCVWGQDGKKCREWADVIVLVCGDAPPPTTGSFAEKFWQLCMERAVCYRRRASLLEDKDAACRQKGRGSVECRDLEVRAGMRPSSCDYPFSGAQP